MEKKSFRVICTVIIAVSLIVSVLFCCIRYRSHRYIMIFNGADKNTLYLEERYIPSVSGQENIQVFVDELLLGPCTEHYKFLFSPGTRAEYSFVRNKVLYVNLSNKALEQRGHTSKIKDGTEIFRKNIFRNFRNINKIEMFVGSKYVTWEQ